MLAQVREQVRVAIEVGDFDQEAAREAVELLRVAPQVVHVLFERRIAAVEHASLESAANRRLLVGREIDTAPSAQLFEQRPHAPIVIGLGRCVRINQQVVEQRSNRLELGDDVHGRRCQRHRHLGVAGGLWILDNHSPAQFLHAARPFGTIGTETGENHGDELLAKCIGGALEQAVDRRRRPRAPRLGLHRDRVIPDFDVVVRGHDIDHPTLQLLAVLHRANG